MRIRLIVWFLVAQILAGLVVFRDAIWGASLLAPLDIFPALFSKFRSLDPATTRVPANHHIIDQVIYDLPLQWVVHQAYQRGETPWWDPYTLCGRPLIADAHISAADPVRWLMYHLLPFEMAYNWTKIFHYLLFGTGMWLLLLRLGFQPVPSLLLALACQYGGGFAMFFGHPWIHASFVYYPFLWLAWMGAMKGRWWAFGLSCLLVAGVLYAGNLQSHAYLGVIGLSFFAGYGIAWKRDWLRCSMIVGGSGVIGALLAAPLLAAELELFGLNARAVVTERHPLGWLSGLFSLSSAYPWGLGTFATLDMSKAVGRINHLGFSMFIGCAAFWLACLGVMRRPANLELLPVRRAGLCLAGCYLVIISTRLNEFLYMRSVPLALMGMTVLAACGWENLRTAQVPFNRFGRVIIACALVAVLGIHIGAFLVYPKFRPRIENMMARASLENKGMDLAPELRAAQIQRFPAEVSFLNPEAAVGFLGSIGAAALFMSVRSRHFARLGFAIFILNLIPLLMFSSRHIPRQPMDLWHRLRQGTPEHRRVVSEMRGSTKRLFESAPGSHERLFPNAIPCLFGIRSVQGYAALAPSNYFSLALSPSNAVLADATYTSTERGQTSGVFADTGASHSVRFFWASDSGRNFQVTETNLCRIQIHFEPGNTGELVWNDTRYPGWKAELDGRQVPISPYGAVANLVQIPSESRHLELTYRPTGLWWGERVAWVTLGFVFCLVIGSAVVQFKVCIRRR